LTTSNFADPLLQKFRTLPKSVKIIQSLFRHIRHYMETNSDIYIYVYMDQMLTLPENELS